jgi:hypothetical protein
MLKVVVASALILATAFSAAVWWLPGSGPIETYRLHDISDRSEKEQLQALAPFAKKGACEYLGEFVERNGEIALEFRINTEDGYSDLGCIKSQAPEGFIFVEVAD